MKGIRLWTVKQAPFLQGDPPTWDFDPGDVTFTPKMVKRVAPGPFAAAPIVQGDAFGGHSLDDDLIEVARGNTVAGSSFMDHIDGNQGSYVVWWKPEFSSSVVTSGLHYIMCSGNSVALFYDYGNAELEFWCFSRSLKVEIEITAGTTYCIVCRWDTKNTLDGTNYQCISVNDSHNFGAASVGSVGASSLVIGNSNQEDDASSGIVEGATIYRRPLFDGTYGIDVGNGDEINLIYAAGSGEDPCLITGSWDIVFCLPTNSTVEEIVTGTGEAWSHPHSSNLLGAGGFMKDAVYTDGGWVDEGTPTAVAVLAAAEKVYHKGYKVTSDAANEGIYKDYTSTPDQDFVIRVLGHSDGTSVPKVILYDQTNTAEIGSLTGTNGSTRTAPDVFIFTGRAPAGCTTLRVKLINTDATASDITYWHQCELLANKMQGPSFETGAGDPWIPDGWSDSSLDAGDTEAEAGTVHSGAGCIQFNAGATDNDGMRNPHDSVASGSFAMLGMWRYGDGSDGIKVVVEGSQWRNHNSLESTWLVPIPTSAAWVHTARVMRRIAGGGATIFLYGQSAGPLYIDDIYLVQLDAVSITVTPASEANSTEGSGIRVDGRDNCTKSIGSLFKATSGRVRFKWIPRHGHGDFEKFLDGSYQTFVCLRNSASNFISFSTTSNTRYVVSITVQSVSSSANWIDPAIVEGTEYLLEIEYDAAKVTIKLDGIVGVTCTPAAGINFGANAPNVIYMSNPVNVNQGDSVFPRTIIYFIARSTHMAYRAVVLSSEAAANGDVHLDVNVDSDRSGSWELIPGGHRTLVLDGDAVMAIINSGDTLANRRLAMKDLFIQEISAWGIDKSDDANEQLTALMYQGWPQTVEL